MEGADVLCPWLGESSAYRETTVEKIVFQVRIAGILPGVLIYAEGGSK